MTDRAVLAHHVLVLEHDARAGAIVRAGIGPASEVHHLIGFDAGGTRIDRIRSDAGEIVDLEEGDRAVLVDADPALHAMVASVNVGDEALEPVSDELDRAFKQFRQRHYRHLVGIGMHLDAEGAADILGDDPDLMLLQAKMFGEQILHHVRRLGRVIDREPLVARIPVGQNGAAFVADAGMATEQERLLHNRVGFLGRLVDLPDIERALEGEVVAELGMDHRRLWIECSFRIGDGSQFLVIHLDQFAGVFGKRARLRHNCTDCLALPAGAVDGERVLWGRLNALQMRQHADPGRDDFREFRPGDDGDDARRLLGFALVDLPDAGMRKRRTQIGDVAHARQHHVADILRAALRKPLQVRARHRAADIGIRPVECGERRGQVGDDFHYKNRVGQRIVRHIWAEGLLSRPRPSFGCRKLRPMISTKSSSSTLAFGSNE